jgi:hypothetical protein
MNKVDIANAVHGKLGGTKVQAEEVVDIVIDSIVSTLKKGGEVSIAGLVPRDRRGILALARASQCHPCACRSSAQLRA